MDVTRLGNSELRVLRKSDYIKLKSLTQIFYAHAQISLTASAVSEECYTGQLGQTAMHDKRDLFMEKRPGAHEAQTAFITQLPSLFRKDKLYLTAESGVVQSPNWVRKISHVAATRVQD